MKKTVLAVLCAIPLCLASCASAPKDTADVLENQEVINEAIAAAIESQEASTTEAETAAEPETSESTDLAAEEEAFPEPETFPEPEAFEEPEIITLEPQDEVIPAEEPEATEPVENEEPPEITVTVESEDTPSAETTETTETSEPQTTAPEETTAETSENNVEDITANDVIIEEKSFDTDSISGGIDITDDDSDSGEEYSEEEKEIIPSRSVTLKKFEYLDVVYPGTGWIYMGLTDNSKDLAYFGRKLGTKDTKFSLQARAAGTKIIHFYRNDPLTGQYLDDYIEVIIQPENGSNKTHIEAPEYKLPVQKKEKPAPVTEDPEASEEEAAEPKEETKTSRTPVISSDVPVASPTTAEKPSAATSSKETTSVKEPAETAAPAPAPVQETAPVTSSNPALLLQDAQVLYNEKEYKAALAKLNQFFEFSTDNRDEALYLKGQILEAKSEVRDIKGSLDAYTTLIKNYPASKYWDSANKRIIYLKRFYLEVR